MRYTTIGLRRSDTDARSISEATYKNLKGMYATVRTYPDGLISYGDARSISLWIKFIRVTETHPFFNLGVFVQTINSQLLPLHTTTLESFIKYMKSK